MLDLYLSEALDYMEEIRIDQIQQYIMLANIVANPHTKEPARLMKMLQSQMDSLTGVADIDEPDPGAFDRLKSILGTKKRKK